MRQNEIEVGGFYLYQDKLVKVVGPFDHWPLADGRRSTTRYFPIQNVPWQDDQQPYQTDKVYPALTKNLAHVESLDRGRTTNMRVAELKARLKIKTDAEREARDQKVIDAHVCQECGLRYDEHDGRELHRFKR